MTKTNTKVNIQQIWEGFHWLFFADIQALIICLRRFENQLAAGNINQAEVELGTATELMIASGAAMELAGSFSKKDYEQKIRPAMKPPNVRAENFSGLMFWDHTSLIKICRKLAPVFKKLPPELHAQHEKFAAAYLVLSGAHTHVCAEFGGNNTGSLRCQKSSAVKRLKGFEKGRLKMLDPNNQLGDGGCPHSSN